MSKDQVKSEPDFRRRCWRRLCANRSPDVVVLGGGVNGAAVLRELSLNGISAVLLDTRDFCSGASSASSRMAHGGLRYLEGREFRLVAESIVERNRLLRDAGHVVKPLQIIVPIKHRVRGFGRSLCRFMGINSCQGPLSLLTLKGALFLYELLDRANRVLPRHSSETGKLTIEGLQSGAIALVKYYDGQITQPEGLIMEMLTEAVDCHDAVSALNYVNWRYADGEFIVSNPDTKAQVTLIPRIIINSSGAWIDQVNRRLGQPTQWVRGVKGAHLVISNAVLTARMNGRAFYFDDSTGRMIIAVPLGKTVLLGTSEIDTDDADDTLISEIEVNYLLASVNALFDDICVTPEHVNLAITGIRPLLAGSGSANAAARDHVVKPLLGGDLPILCLVGGKWTTFRAFAEQTCDEVYRLLGLSRTVSTRHRRYPGALPCAIEDVIAKGITDRQRAARLLDRYGAIAPRVAEFCSKGDDSPLVGASDYSQREIAWLILERAARTARDIIHHRSRIAVDHDINDKLIEELEEIIDATIGEYDKARL